MLRARRRSRKVLVWVGFRVEWSCVGRTLLSDKSRGLEAGMGIGLVDCRVRVQTKASDKSVRPTQDLPSADFTNAPRGWARLGCAESGRLPGLVFWFLPRCRCCQSHSRRPGS